MRAYFLLLSMTGAGCISLFAQQSPMPKLAAYSVDSMTVPVIAPKTKPTLASYQIDSVPTAVSTSTPELKATKKEYPIITPK
ncbi:MAG: hypothetical protein NT084_13515 [Bacteroidetes bacterium]|nr:hypothetical protein [Bacteroidota bacterium]